LFNTDLPVTALGLYLFSRVYLKDRSVSVAPPSDRDSLHLRGQPG